MSRHEKGGYLPRTETSPLYRGTKRGVAYRELRHHPYVAARKSDFLTGTKDNTLMFAARKGDFSYRNYGIMLQLAVRTLTQPLTDINKYIYTGDQP